MVGKAISHANNNFDFLRFWSASFVVWIHCIALLIPFEGKPAYSYITLDIDPLSIISNKYLLISTLGLYLFFFISGYLITKSALSSKSTLDYLWKRFLRILPGLFVCSTLVVLLMGAIYTDLPSAAYLNNPDVWKFYFRSLVLFTDSHIANLWANHPNREVNGSLYTLIYEVQCYIIVVVLYAMGILRKAYSLWAVFIGSVLLFIGLIVLGDKFPSSLHYYLPYTNLDLSRTVDFNIFFFAGALFMHYEKKIPKSGLLFAISIGLFFALCWIPGTGIYAKYIGLPYVIFYLSFINSPSWMRNWAKYGDYSYGIYIYGMPLSQLVVEYMGPAAGSNMFLYILFSWLLSVLAGVISWNLVEKRALAYKGLFGKIA